MTYLDDLEAAASLISSAKADAAGQIAQREATIVDLSAQLTEAQRKYDEHMATHVTPTPEPTPEPLPDIKGVGFWQAKFDAQESSFWSTNLTKSKSTDSQYFYDLAYGIDGYVSMFEATGQLKYLSSAITLTKNMIASATSRAGGFLGWVSQRSDVRGQEVALFESYCWRYVCRMLTAIKESDLYTAPTFKADYDTILAFTERNIFDKWYTRGANNYIYRSNSNMASHWAYIASHLARHTADATRRGRCDTIRENIDYYGLPNYASDSLRKKIRASLNRVPGSGAYSWNANWNNVTRPGQDTNHANAEVAWISESLDYHDTWDDLDVFSLGTTLLKLIMPTHAGNVDGSGTGNGWIADGWVKLGRHNVEIQKALETYDVQGQGQYMAAMAANAKRHGVA